MGGESCDRLPRAGDRREDVDGIAAGRPEDDVLPLNRERHLAAGADLEGVPEDLGDDDLPLRADTHADLEHGPRVYNPGLNSCTTWSNTSSRLPGCLVVADALVPRGRDEVGPHIEQWGAGDH